MRSSSTRLRHRPTTIIAFRKRRARHTLEITQSATGRGCGRGVRRGWGRVGRSQSGEKRNQDQAGMHAV